ncbi:MAG: hypothetical protein ACI4T2_02710 [Christensenellales bacterium]
MQREKSARPLLPLAIPRLFSPAFAVSPLQISGRCEIMKIGETT